MDHGGAQEAGRGRHAGRAAERLWAWLFPVPAGIGDAMLTHQRQALRRQVPILVAVQFSISALTAAVFWPLVAPAFNLTWVGLVWFVGALSLWRWDRSRRAVQQRRATPRFARRPILANAVPGIIWGASALIFFVPERLELQLFLVCALAGMSAGIVAAAPSMPGAALAYVLPAMIPLTIQLLATGARTGVVMGIMAVIYLGALVFILRNGYRSFCDGVAAEERARQAEEVLRDSIDALDDGYVLYDSDLRVVMHNRIYMHHFGHFPPGTKVVGMHLEEVLRSGAQSGYFAADEDYSLDPEGTIARRIADFRGEGRVQAERRLADGRTILVSKHSMPGGRRVAIITDITALKHVEQRFVAAMDAMDDALVLYGPDDRIITHNRRYLELYPVLKDLAPLAGRTREECLRFAAEKGFLAGHGMGGDPERWAAAEVRALQFKKTAEYERQTADGRTYLIRARKTAEGGRVMITTDITALKRAEQRLLAAIEAMDDGFILFGPDDRVLLHNRHYLQHYPFLKEHTSLIGLSREVLLRSALGANALKGIDDRADPEAWIRGQIDLWHGDKVAEYERELADGRTLLVRTQRTTEGGRVAITTDVTALKRAQKRLVDAVESMSDAFVLWDADDRLVLCNSAYAKMFEGVPRSTEVGSRFQDILKAGIAAGVFPEAKGREQDYFTERMARHCDPADPVVQPYRDGRWLRYAERRTSEGGIVGLRTDVTESMRREQALRYSEAELAKRVRELETMQQQLQMQRDELHLLMRQVMQARDEAAAANAAKSVFLANMSHELRTPLNAIIGFSEIMHGELFGALGHPRYTTYVSDMLGAAKHLLKLINDILDLSKIEAGKWELREEPVDVRRLLDSVMHLFRGRDETARLDIKVDAPVALPPIMADERALKQIIINALSNSIKFTPPGGRIRLRARRDKSGRLHLAIGDTGIGIKREDVPKALAPFGQVDNHMTRRHQGTGLGLSIAKALVERHGGRLKLRSAPGRGTIIAAMLPAERFAAAAVAQAKLAAAE